MKEQHFQSPDLSQEAWPEPYDCEDDRPDRLTDYLITTRGPAPGEDPAQPSEQVGSSRPRHRLLIEQALQAQSAHSSLSAPQASVIRWKVPTGALIILALVLSGFALWPVVGDSRGSQEVISPVSAPAQEQAGARSRQEPNNTSDSSTPTSSSSAASGGAVLVHVTGAVISPGLYELKPGGRVNDALTAAGGPRPDANTSAINLAEPVMDGRQIYVPAVGEETVLPPAQATQGKASSSAGSSSATDHLVNINTAEASELQTLPQVGPVLAESIIAWREEHGGFQSVDELDQVSGIGPSKLEKLRPLVTV
ncbi:helix-hairpin-helix domain-containing protein [Rothia sp. CCM 9416]|uniref:helix-hairpin-helix domain-containing protein n=1 Tax=Rothia sp. CCM 9416 TaxID=3402655 RepID=UPI003AE68205